MTLSNPQTLCAVVVISFLLFASPAAAFGAGNIASISKIEGHNWRHGDIEDLLKTVAFLKGHKWTSMMIRRVYFGNWLRDYSQSVDVGTLKGVQAGTIRILVWVLSFLSFGYATGEFEVTEERLGVYRPEEHIDNPKNYADNVDARQYDPRLRPPVAPVELAVDASTGMKNYIANEAGGWATSTGYVKHSFTRSIHFGRVYTSGANATSGKEADLCEALRCLGQGLHCLEDFAAHTNYIELSLRELGLANVFPHVGVGTELNLRGRRAFPLVTGTFGAVDFLHSVLGEATDHFAQTEVEQMDIVLGDAQMNSTQSSRGSKGAGQSDDSLIVLLSQLPGSGGGLASEAQRLRAAADDQERENAELNRARSYQNFEGSRDAVQTTFAAPPGSVGGPPGPGIPGMNPSFDPAKVAAQIYPILEFRDRVVRAISSILEKIPGLEALCEKISETVTLFVLSLLAPFIRPIINAVSKQLQEGSSAVVGSSAKHQFEPWTDPECTDPTHSLLSKDHFSNILNEVAGQVAGVTLQYVAPRIIFAWSHPDVPLQEVMDDILRVFHHPAARDTHCEIHRSMFDTVQRWLNSLPDRGASLNDILSSESVKNGRNHEGGDPHSHGGSAAQHGSGSHSKVRGSEWEKLSARGDDFSGGNRTAAESTSQSYGEHRPSIPGRYPTDSYTSPSPSAMHTHHEPYSNAYQQQHQGSNQNPPPEGAYDTAYDTEYPGRQASGYSDSPSQYGQNAPSGRYTEYDSGRPPSSGVSGWQQYPDDRYR